MGWWPIHRACINTINIPESHGKAATVFPDSLSLQIPGRLLTRLCVVCLYSLSVCFTSVVIDYSLSPCGVCVCVCRFILFSCVRFALTSQSTSGLYWERSDRLVLCFILIVKPQPFIMCSLHFPVVYSACIHTCILFIMCLQLPLLLLLPHALHVCVCVRACACVSLSVLCLPL